MKPPSASTEPTQPQPASPDTATLHSGRTFPKFRSVCARRDTRECTVIGAGSRVEVWDSAAWASYLEASEEAFADQSEEVVPGLF